LLERLASEKDKQAGNDLADILIKLDWRQFRKQQFEKPIEVTAPDQIVVSEIVKPQPRREDKPKMMTETTTTSNRISGRDRRTQSNWDERILKIERFFNSIDLPSGEIRLSKSEVITDVQKFINSHLSQVKRHNGKMTFEPYLLRLEKLKNIIYKKSMVKKELFRARIAGIFNINYRLHTSYPFKKFDIKTEETIHRDSGIDELRRIIRSFNF
jgi:hypothetical protein